MSPSQPHRSPDPTNKQQSCRVNGFREELMLSCPALHAGLFFFLPAAKKEAPLWTRLARRRDGRRSTHGLLSLCLCSAAMLSALRALLCSVQCSAVLQEWPMQCNCWGLQLQLGAVDLVQFGGQAAAPSPPPPFSMPPSRGTALLPHCWRSMGEINSHINWGSCGAQRGGTTHPSVRPSVHPGTPLGSCSIPWRPGDAPHHSQQQLCPRNDLIKP